MAFQLPGFEYPPMEYDQSYIINEFEKLHAAINFLLSMLQLPTLHTEPVKVWDGLLVKADGTDWNPGSGAGVYVYDGGTSAWKAVTTY